MVRISRQSDPQRIDDLRKKIQNTEYIEEAIRKIAQRLSLELIHATRRHRA
jgi:hypothetical protein